MRKNKKIIINEGILDIHEFTKDKSKKYPIIGRVPLSLEFYEAFYESIMKEFQSAYNEYFRDKNIRRLTFVKSYIEYLVRKDKGGDIPNKEDISEKYTIIMNEFYEVISQKFQSNDFLYDVMDKLSIGLILESVYPKKAQYDDDFIIYNAGFGQKEEVIQFELSLPNIIKIFSEYDGSEYTNKYEKNLQEFISTVQHELVHFAQQKSEHIPDFSYIEKKRKRDIKSGSDEEYFVSDLEIPANGAYIATAYYYQNDKDIDKAIESFKKLEDLENGKGSK